MVCLVNGSTASAAELFASSLRTLNGARLVGTTTQGKGTIQSSPQRLSDGSAVVVTVAKLVCGDGSCFDGTGLTVDVERPLTADEQTAYYDYTVENDPQIQRAVSTAQQMSGTTTVSGVNEAASSEAADSAAAESVAEGDAELHLPRALRQRPRPPKVKQQGRALHPVVKNKRTTLSVSADALPPLPKGEVLAIHAKFAVLSKAPPLGELASEARRRGLFWKRKDRAMPELTDLSYVRACAKNMILPFPRALARTSSSTQACPPRSWMPAVWTSVTAFSRSAPASAC